MSFTCLPNFFDRHRGIKLMLLVISAVFFVVVRDSAGPCVYAAAVRVVQSTLSDSLYNAQHPRLLFSDSDTTALYDKVRDGGYDDDAYSFIRLMVDYIYPGQSSADILGDDYGLAAIPMLGVATYLESPHDENARSMGLAATLYLANNYDRDGYDYGTSLRLRSLALGYDWFFQHASETERQILRDEMASYIDYIIYGTTYGIHLYRPYLSNRSIMVAAAVGLAAIVLADEIDPSIVAEAFEWSDDVIRAWKGFEVDREGAYNEGVLYTGWSMRHLAYYFTARKRYDGYNYACNKIRNMERWIAYELMPEGNGKTNNLNDSGYTDDPLPRHHTYFDWAQYEWNSGLSAYLYEHTAGPYGWNWGQSADKAATVLWNQNLAPVQPDSVLPASSVWTDRGLYYYRSGWPSGDSSEDVVFSFYSGLYNGGHAQEDQNQFTLYGYGGKFAIDHGVGGIGKQSESHNIVFIDGKGQHNAGSSIGTDGEISRYLLAGFADFIQGDATAAYTTYSELNRIGYPLLESRWDWGYDGGNPVLHARRNILAVHGADEIPAYFLIADDIEKDGTVHDYQWRLHTADANTVDTLSSETWINSTTGTGRMILHAVYPPPASMTMGITAYSNVSTEPDSKLITFGVDAVNPRFSFLLFPGDASTAIPAVTREAFAWGVLVTVDWGTFSDVLVLNHSGGTVDVTTALPSGGAAAASRTASSTTSASVQTDASTVMLRFDAGILSRYIAAEAQTLTVDGITLVSVSNGTLCAAMSDNIINIDRYEADFTLYGPGVSEIRYRSQQIYFLENGGYLTPHPVTGVDDAQIAPRRIRAAAFPNPFNPSTTVVFEIEQRSRVSINVYDPLGKLVKRLADDTFDAGGHKLPWDGTNENRQRVSSGIYFVRLASETGTATVKLVVIK